MRKGETNFVSGTMFRGFENHILESISHPGKGNAESFAPSSGEALSSASCFTDSSSRPVSSESFERSNMSAFPVFGIDPLHDCPSNHSKEATCENYQIEPALEGVTATTQLYPTQENELMGDGYLGNFNQCIEGEGPSIMEASKGPQLDAESFSVGESGLLQNSCGAQQVGEYMAPPLGKPDVKKDGGGPTLWTGAGFLKSKSVSLDELLACGEGENMGTCQNGRLPARTLGPQIPDETVSPEGGNRGGAAATKHPTLRRGLGQREICMNVNMNDLPKQRDLKPRTHTSIGKSRMPRQPPKAPQKPPTTAGIGLEQLKEVFHLHRTEAESHLQLKRTTFSNLSRFYGVSKWPYRTLRDADKRMAHNIDLLSRPSTSCEKRRKLEVQQWHLQAVKELMYKEPQQSKDSNTIAVLLQIVAEREGTQPI